MPRGTGIRTAFDRACSLRGLRPTVALQASAPDAIADLAARGLAVGILSESTAARYTPKLTALPIRDIEIPVVLALIWQSSTSPASRELVVQCQAAFHLDAPELTSP